MRTSALLGLTLLIACGDNGLEERARRGPPSRPEPPEPAPVPEGKKVETADYPHPVREFELTWAPS